MASNVKISNLGSKTLQQYQLNNFLGCDFYNEPLNVSKQRTPKMKNLIFDDGVSRKRNGFKQRAIIIDKVTDKRVSINGYWEFDDLLGVKHTIIHAGNKIYRYYYGETLFLDRYEDITTECTYKPSYIDTLDNWKNQTASKIKDVKSYGVIRRNRLYLFAGEIYLVYGCWNYKEITSEQYVFNNNQVVYYFTDLNKYKYNDIFVTKEYAASKLQWELRPVVDNEDTYIPTTTIGIHPTLGVQTPLEEVNLLSRFRYNKLIGDGFKCTLLGSGENYKKPNSDYDNTSAISWNYPFGYKIENRRAYGIKEVEATIYNGNELVGKIIVPASESISIRGGTLNASNDGWDEINAYYYPTNAHSLINEYFYGISISVRYKDNIFNLNSDFDGKTQQVRAEIAFINDFVFYQLDASSIDENTIEVKIGDNLAVPNTDYQIDVDNCRICFLVDTTPLIKGESNITVKFSPNPTKENFNKSANYINKCLFGISFGYNEAQHLFVSGNSDYPNMDWHTINNDLTYFGDLTYSVVGEDNSKIVGYSMLGDNTLAILKEAVNNQSTLFIRSSYLSDVVNAGGDVVYNADGTPYKKVYFSQFETSTKRGCISNRAIQTLGTDKLVLTRDGIFGITNTTNIKTGERILRERSRLVNNKLTKERDLENAVAIVFEDRYYLAINNHIYIADSRFMTSESEEVDDTFSYEYWFWELDNYNNSVITTFFIKDNQLWFGTDKGDICGFSDSNNYTDMMFDKMNITFNNTSKGTQLIYDTTKFKESDFDNNVLAIYDDGENNYLYETLVELSSYDVKYNKTTFFTDTDTMLLKLRYYIDKKLFVKKISPGIDECYITDFNCSDTKNSFALLDNNKNYINYSNNFMETENPFLLDRLIGEYNCKIDDESKGLYLYDASMNGYKHLRREDIQTNVRVLIYKNKPVEAYWYTPVLNLGNATLLKTINYITLLPVVIGHGQMEIGYTTRKFNEMREAIQGIDLYDVEDFNMGFFSFDASKFNRVYTQKKKIRNFVLIQFMYFSNSDRNCAINEIDLTYYVTKHNKGVN